MNMSPQLQQFLSLDAPAMLTATLAAIACGLLGNFLVLRRLSLMGDAISHAVLPGLVAAFLLTGSRATLPMFIGAAIVGVLTAVLVELIHRLGRMEAGAAMGVVFSILFAAGVVMLEQAAARQVDLDPDCVLHGQLERVFWFAPGTWGELLTWHSLTQLPRELWTVAAVAGCALTFIVVFYKELKITAFDPALATALGFSSTTMHFAFMVLVAAAVVASFEAVGSIVVIAMLVCPAATARLLTDRLRTQIVLSAIIAALTGVVGYVSGALAPQWLGWKHSVNVAGMMATLGGVWLVLAALAAPRHGIIARALRRTRLTIDVLREDLLAMLYRAEELRPGGAVTLSQSQVRNVLGGSTALSRAVRRATRSGEIELDDRGVRLRQPGRDRARSIVRAHRLWETFLVRELGLRPDHVHRTAMELEHVTDPAIQSDLAAHHPGDRDPHNRPIPGETP
ncbi:MAG: metal ABC transporter permease [Phycisphaerae bacterium]